MNCRLVARALLSATAAASLAILVANVRGTVVNAQPKASPPQVLYLVTKRGVSAFDLAKQRLLGTFAERHGLAVAADAGGDLYIGIYNPIPESDYFKEFETGKPSRPAREFGSFGSLGGIAISATTGEVAIGANGNGYNGAALEFFAPHGSRPIRKIRQFTNYGSVAYDAAGNLWVEAFGPNYQPYYGYVPPGGTQIAHVHFDGTPGGPMAIDAQGNLVFAWSKEGPPVVYTTLGKRVRSLNLVDMPTAPNGLVISPDGTTLFISGKGATLATYAYPAGGSPIRVFQIHEPATWSSSNALAIGGLFSP